MKTHLLLIGLTVVFVCFGSQLSGQGNIPNGDFESWPPDNDSNPEHWDSPNDATGGFPFYLITVEKTTDSHSGQFAASLTTGSILDEIIPGLLTLGTFELDLDNPEESSFYGIPFSDRPAMLEGYYKYDTPANDNGAIGILLTKFDEENAQRDTIAFGGYMFNQQDPDYAHFSAFLNYLSYEEPDSMNIIILSSASQQMTEGSQLLTDDLSLDYSGTPLVDLGEDVYICPDSSHTFDAGFIEDHTFTWIDLGTDSVVSEEHIFTVDYPGSFQLVVQNQHGLPGLDTVDVFMHDAPLIFDLESEGSFCDDAPLVDFLLNGSQQGVSYTLMNNDNAVSETIAGTGDSIVFESLQEEGAYYVQAVNDLNDCSTNTDTLDTQFVPPPAVFNVTGGGSYGEDENGVEVGLDGSESHVRYLLYRDQDTLLTEKTGTGEALSFGLQKEGLYTVQGVNTEEYCAADMAGQAEVVISTAVDELMLTNLKLAPNPASKGFKVKGLESGKSVEARLVNAAGSVIFSVSFVAGSDGIWRSPDLSHIPSGIYLLNISLKNGKNVTKRVIITS